MFNGWEWGLYPGEWYSVYVGRMGWQALEWFASEMAAGAYLLYHIWGG